MKTEKIYTNFLNKELSLELKKLGFNDPCFAYYTGEEDLKFTEQPLQNINEVWNTLWSEHLERPEATNPYCTAPLYQQTVEFLLEKYQIDIDVCVCFRSGYTTFYKVNVCELEQITQILDNNGKVKVFTSKKEALDEAFMKALEIIKLNF